MITIFHGDNIVSSRNQLHQIVQEHIQKGTEVVKLEGGSLIEEKLIQALQQSSLFSEKRMLVIENIFSLPASGDKDKLVKILLDHPQATVFVWEKKPISPKFKNKLTKNKDVKINEFKTPAVVFKFLDSLKPNNSQQSLILFQQCCQEDSEEMVFYMLCRRISQLIQGSDSSGSYLKGQPWQVGRLKKQAGNFSLKQLLDLHQQLLDIDTRIKTGTNLLPLSSQLDLFLSKL